MKKKGMTLVELMVALLCMTVMMGVVYQLIVTTQRIQIHTGVRAEAEYNIREAMDIMIYEIRHAGYRYYDTMEKGGNPYVFAPTVSRVGTWSRAGEVPYYPTRTGSDTLIISADLDESGTITNNEIINYRVNNNLLERAHQDGGWEMIANNVQRVGFRYFNRDGVEILPADIEANATEINHINIAIDFAYPVKDEARTLTTRLGTSVYFRNTYEF